MHREVKQFEEMPVEYLVQGRVESRVDRCQSRSIRKDSARGICVNEVRTRRLEVISYCNCGCGSRWEDVYIESGSGREPIEKCIVGKRFLSFVVPFNWKAIFLREIHWAAESIPGVSA